ncbi:hypothetical protein [Hymenobacter pini]|uniref:hypothetical protein n=1 Tax=Hymenobacter pini TaxID=2880879 RepID=UPI001CF472A7|nr:hypothetical protein [Hymenobacter pini]MCA8830175.1 hypothetical protein [Hymenobacter pini]
MKPALYLLGFAVLIASCTHDSEPKPTPEEPGEYKGIWKLEGKRRRDYHRADNEFVGEYVESTHFPDDNTDYFVFTPSASTMKLAHTQPKGTNLDTMFIGPFSYYGTQQSLTIDHQGSMYGPVQPTAQGWYAYTVKKFTRKELELEFRRESSLSTYSVHYYTYVRVK